MLHFEALVRFGLRPPPFVGLRRFSCIILLAEKIVLSSLNYFCTLSKLARNIVAGLFLGSPFSSLIYVSVLLPAAYLITAAL